MTQKIDGALPVARAADASAAPATSRTRASRSESVGATVATDNLRLTAEAGDLQVLGRKLGAEPGVDEARVEALRAAIADGSYRIDAQQIATKMLELEKQLDGK